MMVISNHKRLDLQATLVENKITDNQIIYLSPRQPNGTDLRYEWPNYYDIPIDSDPTSWNYGIKLFQKTGLLCWRPEEQVMMARILPQAIPMPEPAPVPQVLAQPAVEIVQQQDEYYD